MPNLTLLDSEASIVVSALNELIASYNRTMNRFPNDTEIQGVLTQMKRRAESVLDKF